MSISFHQKFIEGYIMNRILALILSLVYCGFGQIYKGEVLKGINFAVIYAALIFSLVFLSSVSPLAKLILISLLVFMWLIGMIDAYANDKTFIEGNHGLLWKILIMILIVVGISGSVVAVTALVVQPQIFASDSEDVTIHVDVDNRINNVPQSNPIEIRKSNLVLQEDTSQNQMSKPQTSDNIQESSVRSSNDSESNNSGEIKENKGSEKFNYYTVQVGAFSETERAEALANQLKERGYSVSIISPLTDENPPLYKVHVGKFDNKNKATKIAEKLNKYKDVTGVVIPLNPSI